MDVVQEVVVEMGSNPITAPAEADKPQPIGEKVEVTETPESEKKAEPVQTPEEKFNRDAARQRRAYEKTLREEKDKSSRLEARIAAMEVARQPQTAQKDDSEPTIDKFDNFDQYVAAKASWIAKREVESTLNARDTKAQEARNNEFRSRANEDWGKKVAQATAEMPDFDEVLNSSNVPMTEPMELAIKESDIGPKLAYWLANNPEEAVKIANMAPVGAVRALGRIEERLSGEKPPAKVSNMPAPVPTVKGVQSGVKKDPGKMSDAEYAKWRKSHVA